jgi:hypothetical protein
MGNLKLLVSVKVYAGHKRKKSEVSKVLEHTPRGYSSMKKFKKIQRIMYENKEERLTSGHGRRIQQTKNIKVRGIKKLGGTAQNESEPH